MLVKKKGIYSAIVVPAERVEGGVEAERRGALPLGLPNRLTDWSVDEGSPQYHSVPAPVMYTIMFVMHQRTIHIQSYSVGANQ